jgi:nitroimidazol reductase NimA-like FMN-containing flavoprotein (pyridoxamine 5'-phosphate oxidase superfamily)
MTTDPASSRVRVRRIPEKGRYDRDTVHRIIDGSTYAHVAFVDKGQPFCLPMLCARLDDEVMVHGSTASRTMKLLASGVPACVTVTNMHGLVLARSAFESSANYESVIALGNFHQIVDDRKIAALEALTEKLLPGRWAEARQPTAKELKATLIVAMSLEEAAAKVSAGPPDDDGTADAELDIWAGVIPIMTSYGDPDPSPGLRPGIPIPQSVHDLLRGTGPRDER